MWQPVSYKSVHLWLCLWAHSSVIIITAGFLLPSAWLIWAIKPNTFPAVTSLLASSLWFNTGHMRLCVGNSVARSASWNNSGVYFLFMCHPSNPSRPINHVFNGAASVKESEIKSLQRSSENEADLSPMKAGIIKSQWEKHEWAFRQILYPSPPPGHKTYKHVFLFIYFLLYLEVSVRRSNIVSDMCIWNSAAMAKLIIRIRITTIMITLIIIMLTIIII